MSGEIDAVANRRREVKVVVVGDGAVGKTCLCNVFVKRVFPTAYEPTIFENHVEQMNVAGQVKNIYHCHVQWVPLKKTTLGQPNVVFITDWSLYPK